MLEDCESDEPIEDAPPPRKKQDVKMDAKDADINLLAMTDLSQCKKKDPGDVAVEQGHARCSIWLALRNSSTFSATDLCGKGLCCYSLSDGRHFACMLPSQMHVTSTSIPPADRMV